MSTVTTPDARRVRLRVGVGAALVLVLVGVACAVLLTALAPHGVSRVVPLASAAPTPSTGVIYVHIVGHVTHPGLYALNDGDRAIDLVAAAGGFTTEADERALNLARFLTDGEQVIVFAIGEAMPSAGAGALVNLNSADIAALDTLPRIGPALAERIVSWRDKNGPFSSVDDLLAVPGIGEAILEGLRDLVST